jgi:thiol-disulfide isomerase/thioredoxin
MNRILVAAFATLVAAPLWAQDAPAGSVPPPDETTKPPAEVTPPPTPPPAPPVDPAAVKVAEELLAEVVKAYKAAPTMTDTMTMDMQTPMGAQKQKIEIVIGKGADARMTVAGMAFTAVDGNLYLTREEVRDKYLKTPLEGDMGQTLQKLFGSGDLPMQFTLRSDKANEALLNSLTMGMLENTKIIGHEMIKDDAGKELHAVKLSGDGGSAAVHVEPASKLIAAVKIEFQPPGAPEGFDVKANITMDPKVHEALPTPIAFAPGARKEVSTIEELEPTVIEVGAAMPDFTLQTLSGESVTLSKLAGNVVVLDFWATWCGPCKRALPLVQEFATWAESSGQKIKVYAVDVMEREETPEAIKTKVADFWKAQGFTMQTLLDLDNNVVNQLGFQSIPTTVVVGPDGKVFKIHVGLDPNTVDTLKDDAAKALETKG